ncbi:MAG: cache domain-containing protein [Pseudomonadota bacterium]
MRALRSLLIVLCSTMVYCAQAGEPPETAVAMVEKGAAFLKANGREALLKEVNSKSAEFIQGEVYLLVRAADGTILAHPINPRLVGKNMNELPDADGKYFRKEIVEIARTKGKGWVDYRYNNPLSKEIEKKSSYFVRNGELILEAGIYKGK